MNINSLPMTHFILSEPTLIYLSKHLTTLGEELQSI